jgi:prepilin-type N-terminal cleavage/methylation domain-containing protein
MDMRISSLNKGFTLLELLIVVAIIGILTAITFDYLGSSKERGADAGTKQNLVNARPQAEVYFSNNESYEGVCNSVSFGIYRQIRAAARAQKLTTTGLYEDTTAGSATQEVCHDSGTAYAAWVPLSQGGGICIDSQNNTRTGVPALGANELICP